MALTKLKSSGIADGAVTADGLATGAVTVADIADETITVAKISGNAAASADTFLKKDGTWATVSTTSDIELLNTYTLSDVASLEITTASYFSATYASLVFKFIHMQPATDNVHLRFSLGTGATPTYNNDFYSMFATNQGHNSTTGHWAQDTSYFSWPNTYATLFKELGNGADENCSGNLEVFNASSATYEKMFNASLTGHLYHDYMLCSWSSGGFNLATACTAIKFFFSSGNIANGIVKVYGAR